MSALSFSAPVLWVLFGIVIKADQNALPNCFQVMDKDVKWDVSGFHLVGVKSFLLSEENLETMWYILYNGFVQSILWVAKSFLL